MISRAVVFASSASSARVAGLPLIKRMLLALARAGVTRATVVAPADAGLRRFADQDPEVARAGLLVETVDELPALDPDEPVLAVHADQVCDVGLLKRLAQSAPGTAVVDRKRQHHDDARIALFATTGAALVAAGGGLDALTTADTIDLGSDLWAVADSHDSRRVAERALFQSMRKPVDGPVSRYINRRMSLAVTRLLIKTGVTPNQMTVVATIFGIAGVWFVLRATWATVAIGSTLVQLQSVLDGCDGEIARLKFKSSRFGEWLDNVLDDLVNASYGLALGVASAEMYGEKFFQWLGIGAAAAIMVYNLVVYFQLALRHGTGNPAAFRWWFQKRDADLTVALRGDSLITRSLAVLHSMARRDVFLFIFMFLSFARLPHVAVVWYATLCAIYCLMAVIHVLAGGMPSLPPRDVAGQIKAKAEVP